MDVPLHPFPEAAIRALSPTEVEARLPVWEAIADLWLDTELDEAHLEWIARVLAASPFSLSELREAYLYEVAPAVHHNLLVVAGEWAGFDREWLRDTITAGTARRGRLFHLWVDRGWGRHWMTWATRDDWSTVERRVESLRAAPSPRTLPTARP